MNAIKNYYYILGVTREATDGQIKHAYHQLVQEYHPDHNSSPGAVAHFKDVTEAYGVLSDPEARADYDRQTTPAPSPPSGPAPSMPPRRFHLDLRVGAINVSFRVGPVDSIRPDRKRKGSDRA